ncbi:MAG: hypothetical protein IKW78_05855, partial [Prevotella sp.]|nr:hypothetical protein [Prevotella sp.]
PSFLGSVVGIFLAVASFFRPLQLSNSHLQCKNTKKSVRAMIPSLIFFAIDSFFFKKIIIFAGEKFLTKIIY